MVLILIGVQVAEKILRVGNMVLGGRKSGVRRAAHLVVLLVIQQQVRFAGVVFIHLEIYVLGHGDGEGKVHPIGVRVLVSRRRHRGGQDGLPGTLCAGGISHGAGIGDAPQLVVFVVLDAGVDADTEGGHRRQRDAGDDQQYAE